jgi:hypothetical protein
VGLSVESGGGDLIKEKFARWGSNGSVLRRTRLGNAGKGLLIRPVEGISLTLDSGEGAFNKTLNEHFGREDGVWGPFFLEHGRVHV